MILSRFLYLLDEVKYSFVEAMVKKRSLDEAYFWIAEYYFTEYYEETWNIIWELYYDFYAILNPKYESFIQKKYEEFAMDDVLTVVKSLFPLNIDNSVFKLRMECSSKPSKFYTGRIPSWAKEHTDFILSVHFNHTKNISYQLSLLGADKAYQLIRHYYNRHSEHAVGNKLPDISYSNKHHICMALIYYLSLEEEKINTSLIIRATTEEEVDKIYNTEDDIIKPLRKTLTSKRLYGVSPTIGAFNLNRYNSDIPVEHVLWYHWLYYAYKSPLWKKRLSKYTIRINDQSREINFGSVDDAEEFAEKYDYEPDELPKEVQIRSIRPIFKMDLTEWLEN